MKTLAAAFLLPVLAFGAASPQQNPTPTPKELLDVLRIKTFRVRVPADPDYVWGFQVLRPDQLKPRSARPQGLTRGTGLLAMQEKENGVYAFTLPDRDGAFSQGEFHLCKKTVCGAMYSIHWLERAAYSADGSQVLLAEFTNHPDERPTAYIALVRARSTPEVMEAAPTINLPGPPLPKFFPEEIEIEGSVVAYWWPSHIAMGFEGIFVDILVVRVDKVLRGEVSSKYVRVDFWGNHYPSVGLQLPEEMFRDGSRWRMIFRSSSMVPGETEVCKPLEKETITFVDQETGETQEKPGFRRIQDEEFPPAKQLGCLVVKKEDVARIE